MARSRFEYFSPGTLAEAIDILQRHDNVMVMAGGTDLLLRLKEGAIKAKAVIGLKSIKEVSHITFNKKKGLTIGATALLAHVAEHEAIKKHYPGIATAAQKTANVQIRNMGTVIGNLCNASPSADNAPMLLVLDGKLNIIGPDRKRQLLLKDFFKGPGITTLGKQEIVMSIDVPPPEFNTGTSYLTLSARGQVDCTAVGVSVKLTMDGDICKDAKIAVGACAPVPMRVLETEKCLNGKLLSETQIEEAAKTAVKEICPINDMRASASYRSKIVEVLVQRALKDALENVK